MDRSGYGELHRLLDEHVKFNDLEGVLQPLVGDRKCW